MLYNLAAFDLEGVTKCDDDDVAHDHRTKARIGAAQICIGLPHVLLSDTNFSIRTQRDLIDVEWKDAAFREWASFLVGKIEDVSVHGPRSPYTSVEVIIVT